MEIRWCWFSTNVHLFLKGLTLSQLAPCCRSSWKRNGILLCLVLVTACIYILSTQKSSKHWLADDHSASDVGAVLKVKRKSAPGGYGTRSSQLSWDYSDPILVDLPPKVSATTQPTTSSDIYDEKDMSYGVVIDCGSSGSRVFVYYWPKHSGHPTELLKIRQLTQSGKPVVKKITPGIATFMNRPFSIRNYLKPLILYASENVPTIKHKETPFYVLCTAGMRMLTKRLQGSILEQVQYTIQTSSNFQFYSSYAEVISGMTEGLYFWMGLNYVLGNLQQADHSVLQPHDDSSRTNTHKRSPTVGVIDMGGGSLQIAFEVNKEAKRNFSKQLMEINLGCLEHKSDHEYSVFVDTFLHKGGNAVRVNYEMDLVEDFLKRNNSSHLNIVEDPCLPLGFEQEVRRTLRDTQEVKVLLNGTGDYQLCRKWLIPYLDKSNCDVSSQDCGLNGRQMPPINYNNDKFYGSSEFFYCMDDILRIGGVYNKELYETKAKEYCATPWDETWQKYSDGYYKYADANRVKFQCFKSAWVSVVLHQGFNFPTSYQEFTSVKYLNGSEIQWTLGAILYKTRYLPLREIQLQSLQVKNDKTGGVLSFVLYPFSFLSQYGSILLFVCIGIALLFIVISLVRFGLHMDRKTADGLRRVGSTVAYFVHEEV